MEMGRYYKFDAAPPYRLEWELRYCKVVEEKEDRWVVLGDDTVTHIILKDNAYLSNWREIPRILGMLKIGR